MRKEIRIGVENETAEEQRIRAKVTLYKNIGQNKSNTAINAFNEIRWLLLEHINSMA